MKTKIQKTVLFTIIKIYFKSNPNFRINIVLDEYSKTYNKYNLFVCPICSRECLYTEENINKKDLRIAIKNDLIICCYCYNESKFVIYNLYKKQLKENRRMG
ncbi:MAG: hypothetical protein ACFFAO_02145 [Candidatus Hermodarchaeota archaeon]